MPRFMRKGITEFHWVTTIANVAAPTVAELNAGTSLNPQVAAVNGFTFANSPIMTPDMDNAFVSQIPGEDATEDSNLEMYQIRGVTDTVYNLVEKGDDGYVAIAPKGLATHGTFATGDVVDVFPVTCSSKAKIYTADNEAAKYRLSFAMTQIPTQDFTLA